MKKILSLLVVIALIPSAYADKKKKPQQASGGGGGGSGAPHVPGLSGGGAPRGPSGGGAHMPSMSHGAGSSAGRSMSQSTHRPSVSQPSSHSGMSANNPMSHHSTSSAAGSAASSRPANSSNPLMRRGGQQGTATASSTNPLTHGNQQAGNNAMQKGGQSSKSMLKGGQANNTVQKAGQGNTTMPRGAQANRLNGKGAAAQPGLAARNANARAFNGRARGNFNAQNARGLRGPGAGRSFARGTRANYHVRPYREVFHGYRAVRHDRYWYTNHYDRVVVVGGGYYYWDGGYWYPAWGYDPVYTGYVYDGPIYSYDNLPPDQVIVNVQTQLQDEGYYTGEVDGQLGQQTRDAIGAYQADHDLEVTSAVDEPTVESLGLVESS